MAVRAKPLAGYEPEFAALRSMALRAGECPVFSCERKSGACVGLLVEKAWPEAFGTVARRTIGTGWLRCELPIVRICMAIPAQAACGQASEVAFLMTFSAGKFRVPSRQAKLRGAMVETDYGTIDIKAAGIMALLTFCSGTLKHAVVLIGMAALTAVEGQPFE